MAKTPEYRRGYAAGHARGIRSRPGPSLTIKQMALLEIARRMPEQEFVQAVGAFVASQAKLHVPNGDSLGLAQSLNEAVWPHLSTLGYRP